MAEIQFNVNMDLVDKYVPAEDITIPQEDNLSVKFTYSIFNREVAEDLTGATDIVVSFVKPDGHIVLQSNGTLELPNKVSIVANAQAFTYVGKVYMQVQYKKGTNTFNTRQAFFWVERSNTSCQTVASADFAPYLDNVVATGEILDGLDLQALIDSKQTAEGAQADVNGIKPRVVALEVDVASLKARMTTAEGTISTQGARIIALENSQGSFNTRITNVESKNTQQDGRLSTLETEQANQGSRLNAAENKNTAQDTRLTNLETVSGDIPSIQADIEDIQGVNTNQNNRLSTLEIAKTANDAKNAQQDTNISNNTTAISELQASQTVQDSKITNLESYQTSSDARITSTENKNDQQDIRLANLESGQSTQDDKISTTETKNTQQDTRLTNLENDASSLASTVANNKTAQDTVNTNVNNSVSGLSTRVTTVETKNAQQDTRLDSVESKNASQDAKIASLEGANSVIVSDINSLESTAGAHEFRLDENDTKNAQQDTAISDNKTAITANKVDADSKITGLTARVDAADTDISGLKTKNAQQDTRMTTIENKNTEQDTAIEKINLDLRQRGINVLYPPPPLSPLVGDGVTDDTVRLQEIVNALPANSELIFPKSTGSYLIGQVNFPNGRQNIKIRGTGTIKSKVGDYEANFVFGQYSYYIDIEGLTFIGLKDQVGAPTTYVPNKNTIIKINNGCGYFKIERNTFLDHMGHFITVGAVAGGDVEMGHSIEKNVFRNMVDLGDNRQCAILMQVNCQYSDIINNKFYNCQSSVHALSANNKINFNNIEGATLNIVGLPATPVLNDYFIAKQAHIVLSYEGDPIVYNSSKTQVIGNKINHNFGNAPAILCEGSFARNESYYKITENEILVNRCDYNIMIKNNIGSRIENNQMGNTVVNAHKAHIAILECKNITLDKNHFIGDYKTAVLEGVEFYDGLNTFDKLPLGSTVNYEYITNPNVANKRRPRVLNYTFACIDGSKSGLAPQHTANTWTYVKNSVGNYTVTHNIGHTSYAVNITGDNRIVCIKNMTANSFDILVYSLSGGTAQDGYVYGSLVLSDNRHAGYYNLTIVPERIL